MNEHKDEVDVVTLMTVHSAKGLEFEYVFILGLEEGIFPHNNSLMSDNEIEEERRLCYVAITRAKKKLWLVNAQKRTIYGMDSVNIPSRFISEIDDSHLVKDVKESEIISPSKFKVEIDDSIEYNCGDKVEHTTFGVGVVVGVDKSIISVAFPHPVGIKQLIKGHKSIKKI